MNAEDILRELAVAIADCMRERVKAGKKPLPNDRRYEQHRAWFAARAKEKAA